MICICSKYVYFLLSPLNGRVIIFKASFLKRTGQTGNLVKKKKKKNCRTYKLCQYVELSFLICPQAVWYNQTISQKISVNGRTDYNSVRTKMRNFLVSWSSLVGLLILWSWLELNAVSKTFMFASYEWLMWMKLVEDELVYFIVNFLPIPFLSFYPRQTVHSFSCKIRELLHINMQYSHWDMEWGCA